MVSVPQSQPCLDWALEEDTTVSAPLLASTTSAEVSSGPGSWPNLVACTELGRLPVGRCAADPVGTDVTKET